MSGTVKLPRFGAAVFDLDGTLFDSMPFWSGLDERFLARRGITEVPGDYLLDIAHLGAYETAMYTKKRFGLDDDPYEMMNEWHSEAVRFYRDDVQFKPGALGYLQKLKSEGVKLAVATAGSRELYMSALTRLGAAELFGAFAEVAECERKKGFPDVYLLACERLGSEVHDTVVFEDILTAVQGAKAGGFFTVGVYDETSARDTEQIRQCADAFITGFEELIQGE